MSFSLLNKHIVQSFQTSWLLYFEIKIQIQASESEKLISLVNFNLFVTQRNS